MISLEWLCPLSKKSLRRGFYSLSFNDLLPRTSKPKPLSWITKPSYIYLHVLLALLVITIDCFFSRWYLQSIFSCEHSRQTRLIIISFKSPWNLVALFWTENFILWQIYPEYLRNNQLGNAWSSKQEILFFLLFNDLSPPRTREPLSWIT